jgi:hypothetical protein
MRPFLLFIIAIGISMNVSAQPKIGQRLVVAVYSDGKAPESNGKKVTFFPSEVVTVLKIKGNSILVSGDDNSASAWVPQIAFIDASSFSPITHWSAESKFFVSSASGDSGQSYVFKSDGIFHVEEYGGDKPKKWSGRLYRNGSIIWAKPARITQSFEYWSVFRQLSNQKLCKLYFDTPLGCECVGTQDSKFTATFTTSCK